MAELRDLLRAGVHAEHRARRVAGNQPQQQEGDDGHAEDDRDRGGEPPRRITEHGTARPAARAGRAGRAAPPPARLAQPDVLQPVGAARVHREAVQLRGQA